MKKEDDKERERREIKTGRGQERREEKELDSTSGTMT